MNVSIIMSVYLVSYKTTNNKRIEKGYCCTFEIIYLTTIFNYIAVTGVL